MNEPAIEHPERIMRHITAPLSCVLFATLFSATGIAQEFAPSSPEFERRDRPVSEEDLRILLRANELLADSSVWNREDDRACEDDDELGVRSLFCALYRASIDVSGTYDHRRVALQEVRFAIEDVTDGFDFAHRLMDYNNLPQTKLSDVKNVLRTAQDRVRSRLEED